MDNNNLNIKDLNNTQQPNMEVKQLKILEQPELTEQITTEEAQYRYLKELNKKLTLFKKTKWPIWKEGWGNWTNNEEVKNEF